MFNFDKLSPTPDFISKINTALGVLNGNILYITHESDKILKIVKVLETSLNLQKQVDDYFDDEDSKQDIPEDKEPD